MKYSLEELLAVGIARSIEDGEVGFTGLATGKEAANYITNIPVMGMELAKRTHAPNMTILLCGWVHNPDLSQLNSMPESEFESELLNLACEAQMQDYPGTWAYKAGDINFAFGSGAQVDREGNINCTCIGHTDAPKVQLVGPIFLPEHFAVFGREYIMMPRHNRRNFVEKVDHVSGVGFPGGMEGRKKLNLPGCGPKYIYTPKCIFSFDDNGKIFVKSIHPDISHEEIIESTGFDVGCLDGVPVTLEPTAEELRIMREEIDPKRILMEGGDKIAGQLYC
jgi:glutaconate CoA-transferase subunit B